ncbi:mycolipanoate synthase [Menidia menidia]
MEHTEDDIAVIGIGCNFPGGEGLDSFWRVLLEGKTYAADIPAERFDTTFWYDADAKKPGKTQTTKASLIEGFNEFDHKFFGIAEVEADSMDPQQKLLLQCTYRMLEDAGISMESISGSRTGVYIGLMNRDYEMLRNNSPGTITHYNGTGTAMSVAANRISFTFNLTGPSFAIDSACSSSLVALHLSCQAIKQGDCEMAICGGVNCIIEPRMFVALSKAKMISPEGTSKPFSTRADGYGRGEGCGLVLLKPLSKAIKDCDKIWGIVSKTAVNQDGHSVTPITKPSMTKQEDLLHRIYSDSDIAQVDYIEAHGTGTTVGDPIEAGSISNVIANARPPGSETLRIGSLKGNIGHTESAAGVAGLIKVLLMMRHKIIVPSVFHSADHASVDLKALKLIIPTKADSWELNASPGRVAGVNSFGFGGTNAHAILREYSYTVDPMKAWTQIFVFSAASEKSMVMTITDTHQRLNSSQEVDLQALSYTSACRRSHLKHKYRKALSALSLPDLKQKLTSAMKTKAQPVRSDIQVVFVFCGNGVSYGGMCRQLMKEIPAFREKIREVENIFQCYKDMSISGWLAGDYDEGDFSQPGVVQPLLFAIQVSLSSLLKRWGVKPDIVLGHSVGEVAAAHCSGLLSLRDAVKVLFHRSALQSKLPKGKMLVVSNLSVEKVLAVISDFSGKICVAAFNSPQSCTLSGEAEALDALLIRLKLMFPDKNLFLHVLDVPVAYHSHMMDPVLDDIERNIGPLDSKNMGCKLFSTVSGERYSDGDFSSGTYWAKNIRKPVLFGQALRAATKDKPSNRNLLFVEIAPRRALHRYIQETLGNNTIVLSPVHPEKDCNAISSTLAELFELGVNVDWHQVYSGSETFPTSFPVYQFENTKKDVNFEALREGNQLATFHPRSLVSHMNDKELMCNLTLETTPFLWEHKNNDVAIVPGAFYVELAFASVMATLQPKKPVSQLRLRVSFKSLLTLNSNCQQLKITLEHQEKEGSFKIQSSAATHASGTYRCSSQEPLLEEATICLEIIFQRCALVMSRHEIYSVLSQAGFEYGPLFRQLSDVHFGKEFREAVTTLQVPNELLKYLHEYFVHPVLLDYFMQMTAVTAMGQLASKQGFPSRVASIVLSGPLQKEMVLYLRATQETPDFLEVCGCFATMGGDVLVELTGVRISFLDGYSNVPQSLFFHNETVLVADDGALQGLPLKAIVFGDNLGIAKGLRPYISSESVIVECGEKLKAKEVGQLVLHSLRSKQDLEHVLFVCGVEDVTHLSSERVLDILVACCEKFRCIVLAVKESQRPCTVTVVTHRSTEPTADRISPGFILSGLTRACAAEISDLSFQLIDVSSVSSEDIKMLARVIETCEQQEVRISKGRASATRIAPTPGEEQKLFHGETLSVHPRDFVLQTADPYRITNLSAISAHTVVSPVPEKFVEIRLTNVCLHSSDYFPVTSSHLKHGRTLYWNEHSSHHHKLLALDFGGVVTAVGKDVKNLSVGDHVTSCYPVTASATALIPEAACYDTKTFPFFRQTPCVSYFILAWEILQRLQSDGHKQQRRLALISYNSASALMKVLALTACRSGWNVSSLHNFPWGKPHFDAFVFLPPFDCSWRGMSDGFGLGKHVIFVFSSYASPLVSSTMFAMKSDIFVHKLDMAEVLLKANLQAKKMHIFKWLLSLGFGAESLPLRQELFQVKQPESYFSTTTVQQVVLEPGRDGSRTDMPVLARPRKLFKQSSVYIVTGGLSGLGFETVKFIAHNGGGCIATLSRSIPSDEMRSEMDRLQSRYGVAIMNIQCDVSVSMQVVDAMSKIGERFPFYPVKGVFHSAAVLHDALIEFLDQSLFRRVLQPKVSGVLNLHYATLDKKLDFFVCYSSISSFLGNASQCNYAAANSFLDAFCHYRRNLGLAAQSINWGPLNVGLLLNKDHFQKFLETKGMMVMGVHEIHESLERCLLMNRSQQVICKFNFRNLNTHVLSQNTFLRERLSALVEAELKNEMHIKPRVQHLSSTQETVRRIVGDVLNLSAGEVEDNSSLCALGVDSMLAMTLQNKIFQETGINVPLVMILDPNSVLTTLVNAVLNSG